MIESDEARIKRRPMNGFVAAVNRVIGATWLMLSIVTGSADAATSPDEDAPRSARQNTQPKVTVAPQFPDSSFGRGEDGWALMRVTLNSEGRVEDIGADGASNIAFEKAAARAIARFRWTPRMAHGKPVATDNVIYSFSFLTAGRTPRQATFEVDPEVAAHGEKILAALQNDDEAAAKALLDELGDRRRFSFAEYGLLAALRGEYYAARKENGEAIDWFTRAETTAGLSNARPYILGRLARLLFEQQRSVEALMHYAAAGKDRDRFTGRGPSTDQLAALHARAPQKMLPRLYPVPVDVTIDQACVTGRDRCACKLARNSDPLRGGFRVQ
jgi:hypothetical protein